MGRVPGFLAVSRQDVGSDDDTHGISKQGSRGLRRGAPLARAKTRLSEPVGAVQCNNRECGPWGFPHWASASLRFMLRRGPTHVAAWRQPFALQVVDDRCRLSVSWQIFRFGQKVARVAGMRRSRSSVEDDVSQRHKAKCRGGQGDQQQHAENMCRQFLSHFAFPIPCRTFHRPGSGATCETVNQNIAFSPINSIKMWPSKQWKPLHTIPLPFNPPTQPQPARWPDRRLAARAASGGSCG